MINQQLIDYIHKQLSENIAREAIKSNLMLQGWTEQDVTEGFRMVERPVIGSTGLWTKSIPRTNNVFMVISLVLVFGLDLVILISNPSLASFWYVMLVVLTVFIIFYYLENFLFRKRFAGTTSRLDKWISLIIVLRNIIFLLNFIPFIQLLGLALLGSGLSVIPGFFGGGGLEVLGRFGIFVLVAPVLIVSYIILIVSRYSTTKSTI